jgi:hypothetical protein
MATPKLPLLSSLAAPMMPWLARDVGLIWLAVGALPNRLSIDDMDDAP